MNQQDINEIQADRLTDLPVTDEQADRAIGGSSANQGKLIVGIDNVQVR